MKKLPLGYSTLPEIVKNSRVYVDKTKYLYNMIDSGKFFFMSKPRRFGKSLTVSTVKEIFNGNRDLFKDTFIYNSDYNWVKYPVVHFDFSKFDADKDINELSKIIIKTIDDVALAYNITLSHDIMTLRFEELLMSLSKIEQVVVLIDEYDNPLISNITNIEKAQEIKDILKGFYKIIKSCDEYVKFAFLTGVTKFSQRSIFSGLNNLTDISMDTRYSAICGYTQKELENSFRDYIDKWMNKSGVNRANILDEIKEWYNGFLFSEDGEKVYNPWSTLNYFDTGKFKNYWFETGTPTFLIDLIKSENFDIADRNNFKASSTSFSTFDIENLEVLPLLFQTGYITIKKYNSELDYYTLGYPNREVSNSFINSLLKSVSRVNSDNILIRLTTSLLKNDLESFFESMDTLMNLP